MSDPVVLRSIKRLGEDNCAFDLDGKGKNFILQLSRYFIQHVKKVVGGLSGANCLQNTKQRDCGISIALCGTCCHARAACKTTFL